MNTPLLSKNKIDLSYLIDICFFVVFLGIFYQSTYEVSIPDLYAWDTIFLFNITAYSYSIFLVTRFVFRFFNPLPTYLGFEHATFRYYRLFFAFLSLYLIVVSVLIYYGIPLLESASSPDLKTSVTTISYGFNRIKDIILPLLSFTLIAHTFVTLKNPLVSFIVFVLTLFLMIACAFKGQILYFICMLLFFLAICQRSSLNFATLIFISLFCLMIVSTVFYISEADDFLYSIQYVFERVFIYSISGLNFILTNNVEPDFVDQLQVFLGYTTNQYSPDISLSMQYYRLDNVNIGIVPTLIGFGFRNGGYAGLFLLFTIFSFVFLLIQNLAYSSQSVFKTCACVFALIILIHLFFTGNVFNEIRGSFVTLYFAYIVISKFI